MEQQLKDEWIAKLRSGEFKQGRTELYDPSNDSYCCLGVLGMCIGKTQEELANLVSYNFLKPYLSGEQMRQLWARNDGVGKFSKAWTFEQIADYIEENI